MVSFFLKKIFLIRYMDACQVFRGIDVDFCQFLDGSLMEVSFLSLSIIEIPAVIQNKTKGTKN